jgi:HAMP domain-containing protein
MKKLSIRARILSGVVVVNLLGAIVVMVYMHQSYQQSLVSSTAATTAHALAAWEILEDDAALEPVANSAKISQVIQDMKAVTGADYAFLLSKSSTTAGGYAAMRDATDQPNNWDELESFAVLAITDPAMTDKVRFNVDAGSVPEAGKFVGIENGACSKTCHDGVTGEGDYWEVRWSEDSESRAHSVFPIFGTSGEAVGAIYTIEDVSSKADTARDSMTKTLTVIGITLLIATIFIGYLVDTLVFRRLGHMVTNIQDISMRVAGGDFDARFVPDGTTDEIGSFETFFGQLMDLMSMTLKSMMDRDGR